jgi:hypothetical protein
LVSRVVNSLGAAAITSGINETLVTADVAVGVGRSESVGDEVVGSVDREVVDTTSAAGLPILEVSLRLR